MQVQDISSPSRHEGLSQESAEMGESGQTQDMGNYSGPVERCLRNFILGKKIGAGTFSKVCIAKHRQTSEQVAIKIIEKSKIENEADRVRLEREMKIMRKVRHPNIAQLYQIIETNKYIYLVMQYAARGQLFEHIVSHEKLNEFEASKFLLQLVDAIDYLHQLGIAHRDLKPENMLLDHKYNIKVTDFGLSNLYPAGKLLNTACGSPSYACPEMLAGKPYDGLKADIWSIGIVLYAMCFGYLPFDNPNIGQLYKLIKQGEFEIPEFASNNLIDLLQKILQVNPAERATIPEIRAHPFCKYSIPSNNLMKSIPGIIVGLSDIPFETHIEQQMRNQLNLDTKHLRQEIKKNKHNENTCTYYLLLQRWLRSNSQSLSNYYANKYNVINRYALIERVKANYDRMQFRRMEIRKFQVVQEEIRGRNRADENLCPAGQATAVKEGKKKIVHSAQTQSKRTQEGDDAEEDQNYLQSHMRHFAPNNTKLIAESKNKKARDKSLSKSKSKSKSQSKSQSNSKSKNMKSNTKITKMLTDQKKMVKKSKKQIQRSNVLEIPREFVSSGKKSQKSPTRSSSKKKQGSLSVGKKLANTMCKQQGQSRKRNNSQSRGVKLRF